MKIKNLHDQEDWEKYYKHHPPLEVKLSSGIFNSYDIFLCDYLIKKHIPENKDLLKNLPVICEIGGGDGLLVKKFAQMIGYKPYSIEYSKKAAAISARNGVEVYVADAFDKKVTSKFKNKFDAVFSYGFIEHIIPPEKAIRLHYDLVKPGGYVIIQIPRFKAFNYLRLLLFRPDLIKNHNLEIMNEDILGKLCKDPEIKKIFCGNYGTFKLRLPMEEKNLKYYTLKVICYFDYILNPLFRILFGSKGFESYLFSPSVLFIGQKKK
ncbi:MAG: hypothetical protein ACD_37C00280G0002 [uncultured bacterium]|nr:MAG: hypothetical protein ACD_37C00280G0002 [uncultured bacterium]